MTIEPLLNSNNAADIPIRRREIRLKSQLQAETLSKMPKGSRISMLSTALASVGRSGLRVDW